MFGRGIPLFRLLGIQVLIDLSWFFLAILIVWSLAVGLFPAQVPGLPAATYWWMGIAGAIGLFFSIIFHEYGHALTARRYGLEIEGITLFIFGGVAQLSDEPRTARAEFVVAIMGPIASYVLAAGFYALYALGAAGGWPLAVEAVLGYLAFINIVLATFNLIPAFPLDGGRILRAGLWAWRGDLRWASRISYHTGSVLGFTLIALGVLSLVSGNIIGGIWWALIGLFVRAAAYSSYQHVVVREGLRGVPVRRVMNPEPVAVPPDISLQRLVDEYIYRHYHDFYPVVDGERLVGCIGLPQVRGVPREDWSGVTVGDAMAGCSEETSVDADIDAVDALGAMNRAGTSRVLVISGGRLAGILTLKDLMRFLAVRLDLEKSEPDAARDVMRQAGLHDPGRRTRRT